MTVSKFIFSLMIGLPAQNAFLVQAIEHKQEHDYSLPTSLDLRFAPAAFPESLGGAMVTPPAAIARTSGQEKLKVWDTHDVMPV